MTARDVLARLRAGGFTLFRDGDRLMVAPARQLHPDLRAALEAEHATVLGILKWELARGHEDPPARCPLCGDRTWAMLEADATWFCAGCFPRSATMTDAQFTDLLGVEA